MSVTGIRQDIEWEDYIKSIGENLRRYRKQLKLSQAEVARAAKISKVQYQRIESGGFNDSLSPNPTSRTLIALAEVLDVDLEHLLPKPWPDLREYGKQDISAKD